MQLSQLNANEDPDRDNMAMSEVLERNIRKIVQLRTKDAKEHRSQSRIAGDIASKRSSRAKGKGL